MKRKLLACVLTLSLILGLAACGGGRSTRNDSSEDSSYTPVVVAPALPVRTVRVGLVCGSNSDGQAWTENFLQGREDANAALSPRSIQAGWTIRYDVTVDSSGEVNRELAEEGCQIIFNTAPEYEDGMREAAADFPDVEFVSLGGQESWNDDLDNTHNAFAAVYEARYLEGVAAGMKLLELTAVPEPEAAEEPEDVEDGTEAAAETDETAEEPEEVEEPEEEEEAEPAEPVEPIVGYVAAFPVAEVISGYTAWFLGVRSVCSDAEMKVYFTDDWYNPEAEAEAVAELADEGCVIIGQHTDSTAPALAAQEAGIYHTGYNRDMTADAPDASLVSARIDWSSYFDYAIDSVVLGVPFDQDWCHGLDQRVVELTALNSALTAPGTEAKLSEVQAALRDGTIQVFDTSAFTVDDEEVTTVLTLDTDGDGEADEDEAVVDGAFRESWFQSAPYFNLNIDGIEFLN